MTSQHDATAGTATRGAKPEHKPPSPSSRTEWLAWRRRGLGGSDAAAIAGLDPYHTPVHVWLDKTGLIPLDEEGSEAALWGQLLEPVIADEFQRRRDLWVRQRQAQVVSVHNDWLRATLDGFVYEHPPVGVGFGAGPVAIYEGKTTSSIRHSLDWGDDPPDRVILQVQHNLAATDHTSAWVTCLIGGQRMRIFQIERDDDLIHSMLELEQRFWEKHVLANVPPPVLGTESEGQALRSAFLNSDASASVDLDEHGMHLVRARQLAKAAEKVAKGQVEEAENELMLLLGVAEEGRFEGREVVTFRRVETKQLDREALIQAYPGLYQRFTKAAAYRRFYVPKNALKGTSNGEVD